MDKRARRNKPRFRPPSLHPAIASNDTLIGYDDELISEDVVTPKLDVKGITRYFLGFWNSKHAKEAMMYLELLEKRKHVRKLQKEYGCWRPPAEIAEALRKPTKSTNFSNLPDNKDTRNLRFVLKTLGCSLHENLPYKQFLKAQTLRQKRKWLYTYQGSVYQTKNDYTEPICATRLKRLYHYFPDRFWREDDNVYFNHQLLTYDVTKNIFFIGIARPEDSEVYAD